MRVCVKKEDKSKARGMGVVNVTRVAGKGSGDKFKNRKRLKVHAVDPTARSWNSRAASVVCIGARST